MRRPRLFCCQYLPRHHEKRAYRFEARCLSSLFLTYISLDEERVIFFILTYFHFFFIVVARLHYQVGHHYRILSPLRHRKAIITALRLFFSSFHTVINSHRFARHHFSLLPIRSSLHIIIVTVSFNTTPEWFTLPSSSIATRYHFSSRSHVISALYSLPRLHYYWRISRDRERGTTCGSGIGGVTRNNVNKMHRKCITQQCRGKLGRKAVR